ncbi:MAG: hypothetical protein Ct9H300mP28_13530 [Pseudomonadota bacterium]|nr:MAG: hypothetical protein Ct9H300mP28_13530 [Pseudomonadota bacterium]
MMLESIDISSWNDVRLRALARIAVDKGEIEKARKLLEQLIKQYLILFFGRRARLYS